MSIIYFFRADKKTGSGKIPEPFRVEEIRGVVH